MGFNVENMINHNKSGNFLKIYKTSFMFYNFIFCKVHFEEIFYYFEILLLNHFELIGLVF